MARRTTQPPVTPPDLSPERAHEAISKQFDLLLQKLKGHNCAEVKTEETEWKNLTEKLILRAFGSGSLNLQHFYTACNAGDHYLAPYGATFTHQYYQHNFDERVKAFEAMLRGAFRARA